VLVIATVIKRFKDMPNNSSFSVRQYANIAMGCRVPCEYKYGKKEMV
jgi:hypothetical protein